MHESIILEKNVPFFSSTDIYTIEQRDNFIAIVHKVGGSMQKKIKPEVKRFSYADIRQFFDLFNNLDFTKAWRESGNLVGFDGWTLKCKIYHAATEISIRLWCPSKDESNPETTKLLDACEKVFSLFE